MYRRGISSDARAVVLSLMRGPKLRVAACALGLIWGSSAGAVMGQSVAPAPGSAPTANVLQGNTAAPPGAPGTSSYYYVGAEPPGAGRQASNDRQNVPQPPAPSPNGAAPRVIPLDPILNASPAPAAVPAPHLINFPTDGTGLRPQRPAVATETRSPEEVTRDVNNLVENVSAPEAEISLLENQTKIVQTRRDLTRISIGNPASPISRS